MLSTRTSARSIRRAKNIRWTNNTRSRRFNLYLFVTFVALSVLSSQWCGALEVHGDQARYCPTQAVIDVLANDIGTTGAPLEVSLLPGDCPGEIIDLGRGLFDISAALGAGAHCTFDYMVSEGGQSSTATVTLTRSGDCIIPEIRIEGLVTDFGEVALGGSEIFRTVQIHNDGRADLEVTGVLENTLNTNFAGTGSVFSGLTLEPGQGRAFNLIFNSDLLGASAALMTLDHNDPRFASPLSYTLSGTVVEPTCAHRQAYGAGVSAPGIIESERYDEIPSAISQNCTYFDASSSNEPSEGGTAYRQHEYVDAGYWNGAWYVQRIEPDEWIEYTVDAHYAGLFDVAFRYADLSSNTPGRVRIQTRSAPDSSTVLSDTQWIDLPASQAATRSAAEFELPDPLMLVDGANILRVYMEDHGQYFDRFELSATSQLVMATADGGDIDVDWSSATGTELDLGQVEHATGDQIQNLQIFNHGNEPVAVDVALSGQRLALNFGQTRYLPPGGASQFALSLETDVTGTHQGTMAISVDGEAYLDVPVRGTVISAPMALRVVGAENDELSLGDFEINSGVHARPLALVNQGHVALDLSMVRIAGSSLWSIDPQDASIEPGALLVADLSLSTSATAGPVESTYQFTDQFGRILSLNVSGILHDPDDDTDTSPVTNLAPVAYPDTAAVRPCGSPIEPCPEVQIDVLADDLDPEGGAIVFDGIEVAPEYGTAVWNAANGRVEYTPAPAFRYTNTLFDSFEYRIRDDHDNLAVGYVHVAVMNRPPVAVSEIMHADANSLVPTSYAIGIQSNDYDVDADQFDDTLRYYPVDPVTGERTPGLMGQSLHGGAVDLSGSPYTYQVPQNYLGLDRFDYQVEDDQQQVANASIYFSVNHDAIAAPVDSINLYTDAQKIVGDWDGDGKAGFGFAVLLANQIRFLLCDSNGVEDGGCSESGPRPYEYDFLTGLPAGDEHTIIAGDFDDDGRDDIGIFIGSTQDLYYLVGGLCTPINAGCNAQVRMHHVNAFASLPASDAKYVKPFIGKPTANGRDRFGLFLTKSVGGRSVGSVLFAENHGAVAPGQDLDLDNGLTYRFYDTEWVQSVDETWSPLFGDWDGDGDETIGLVQPAYPLAGVPGTIYLRNSNSFGASDHALHNLFGEFVMADRFAGPGPAQIVMGRSTTLQNTNVSLRVLGAPAEWLQFLLVDDPLAALYQFAAHNLDPPITEPSVTVDGVEYASGDSVFIPRSVLAKGGALAEITLANLRTQEIAVSASATGGFLPTSSQFSVDPLSTASVGLGFTASGMGEGQLVLQSSGFAGRTGTGANQAKSAFTLQLLLENAPPHLRLDSWTVTSRDERCIDVLNNDVDPDGDALQIISATIVNGDTLLRIEGSQLCVTLQSGSLASAEYTVEDSYGAQAQQHLEVTLSEGLPVQVGIDHIETTVNAPSLCTDVLANDVDPDGEPLTLVGWGQPARGLVTAQNGACLQYTPGPDFIGEDEFSYTVTDGYGESQGRVMITVHSAGVVARNDAYSIVGTDAVSLDVLANDTNLDRGGFGIYAFSAPAVGTVSLAGDGLALVYTPDLGYVGDVQFEYTVIDAQGDRDSAEVTVDVGNQGPVANPDEARVVSGRSVAVPVLENDNDPDGHALTVSIIEPPSAGNATVDVNGVISVTAPQGYLGSIEVVYEISDPHGGTATAMLRVTAFTIIFNHDRRMHEVEVTDEFGLPIFSDGQPVTEEVERSLITPIVIDGRQ